MFPKKAILLVIGGILLAGCCSVVHRAREAQKAIRPRSLGVVSALPRVNLRGSTLEQLVDFAMTNRPTVQVAALAVADAKLAMRELASDAPFLSTTPFLAPKLNARGGYSATSDSALFADLEAKTRGNASAGLSLDLLICDFGRHSAQMAAAAENVVAAEAELTRVCYNVFEDVATSYFNLLAADALMEVACTNEHEYAVHLQYNRERLDSGEAQRLDVTRAQLDLAKARQQTVAASNSVVTCGAELMRALGIDANGGTREDVLPPMRDAMTAAMRAFPSTKYDVETAFDLARTNAPGMAVLRAKLRAASARVDYAVADLRPELSASVSLSWTDPFWVWGWGVNAVQSLFRGFRKTTAVDRAVMQLKSASAAVDEGEQELSRNLELAIANRDNALEANATAWKSVLAAKENLDTVKAQFEQGDVSRVDFTDAVNDFATAIGSCISAFYKGQICEAYLFALVGRMPEYDEKKLTERNLK